MRALLCAALTVFSAHALYAIGWLGGSQLGWLAESLGYGGLLIVALVLMYRSNRSLLRGRRSEARTDPLTGLANRRQLMEDLARAHRSPTPTHGSSRSSTSTASSRTTTASAIPPVTRCSPSSPSASRPRSRPTVAPTGWAETSSASSRPARQDAPRADRGGVRRRSRRTARASRSEARAASSSCPQEADDAGDALRLADRRMYAAKSRRPRSAERQTRNVLLRVLREREPELDQHLRSVAQLAIELGQAIHLDAERARRGRARRRAPRHRQDRRARRDPAQARRR